MARINQRPTTPGGDAMIFDRLFHLMAEKQASDIFVTAGAAIHIKIQGR
jgi:Tfp pilus assembly ATPase PilU